MQLFVQFACTEIFFCGQKIFRDGPHDKPEFTALAAFPTTHWSLVARAGSSDIESQRKALMQFLNPLHARAAASPGGPQAPR
jgi:hypothetical protein